MMVWKILIAIELLTWASPSFAIGTFIAVTVIGLQAGSIAALATAFAINLIASQIISRALAPDPPSIGGGAYAPNPGQRTQVPPAGSNKLPIVYGTAYTGGTIVDLSITADNKNLYYVLALCEVTGSENGGTGDTISIGNIYWGGKRCSFDGVDTTNVNALIDESTGTSDGSINGYLRIYLYKNGSNQPLNTNLSAIQVMQDPQLIYQWDNTKLMTNTVFAIIKITYNYDARVTGLLTTKFQVINPRTLPGDCFSDYLRSSRYGGALTASQVDQNSLNALNQYSDVLVPYTTFLNNPAQLRRFQFDGLLETTQSVLTNMQYMAQSCDCLIKYNEIEGTWGVIVQTPTAVPTLDLDDSNIVSPIQVSPIDIASSYNIVEVKFPNKTEQDGFASAIYDLRQYNPALLYPNEPINKEQISLFLVNDSVRAQYLATRFLEGAREDLQVRVQVNFIGLQIEAGDVVRLTQVNYGWSLKLFRVTKVTQKFDGAGNISADLFLSEYNPQVFDDRNIKEFTPAPNTGIPDGSVFGYIPPPTIDNVVQTGINPGFDVEVTTATTGIIQYAEVYYANTSTPTFQQLTFGGSTTPNPAGVPLPNNTVLPAIHFGAGLPVGNYYFFSRMRSGLAASQVSPPSSALYWDPAYVDDVMNFKNDGTLLSWNPVLNPDLAGYDIRYHYGANQDWNSAIPLTMGVVTTTTYDAVNLPLQLVTIMIKAKDVYGNESRNAAVVETIPYDGMDIDNDNLVFIYDFKANLWPGTVTGGTVVGAPPNNNLVGTVNDSFYGDDAHSIYGYDTASFYQQFPVSEVQYTSNPIYIDEAYQGSNAKALFTSTAKDNLVEYRPVNDASFYGPDLDSFYEADPDSFYGVDNLSWTPITGVFNIKRDIYQFRFTAFPDTAITISQFQLIVDARVIVEYLPNLVVTGAVIPYTKPFVFIKTIQATLQSNLLGVQGILINKTTNLAPTVTGFNASGTQVNGALADLIIEGY